MSQRLALKGLQDPSAIEFLHHPDFRPMAAFFLGWVFLYSLQIIACSKTWRTLLSFKPLCSQLHSHATPDLEARTPRASNTPPVEKTPMSENTFDRHQSLRANEGYALILTLALCFASASIAHFTSLLDFSTRNGETACAFVIAWGGLAGKAARLVGLLILGRELRRLGLQLSGICFFYVMLGATLGLIFANNAIGTGTAIYVPQLDVSLCYKRNFAPTGIASTCLLLMLDVYVVTRTVTFIAPTFLRWGHRVETITDSRILKALSLMFLDALTIPSDVVSANLLVDFIPFSVGALVVLAVFSSPFKLDEDRSSGIFPESLHSSMHSTATSPRGSSIRNTDGHTTSGFSSQNAVDSGGSSRSIDVGYVDMNLGVPRPRHIAAETTLIRQNPSAAHSLLPPHSMPPLRTASTVSLLRLPVPSPKQPSVLASILAPTPSRQILLDQAKYAERLEQEQSLPPDLSWKNQLHLRASTVMIGDRRDSAPETLTSLVSVIYGSDIIRTNPAEPAYSASPTTDPTHISFDGIAMSAFSSSSWGSRSSHRVSFMVPSSPQPPQDTLEIVHEQERLHHVVRKTNSLERRNTFGYRRQSLKQVPSELTPPAISVLPLLASSLGSSSRIRYPPMPSGPRPLVPISPSQRSLFPIVYRSQAG